MPGIHEDCYMNFTAYLVPLILLALTVMLALMILSEIQNSKISMREIWDVLPSLQARLEALMSAPVSANTGSGDRPSGSPTRSTSGRAGVDKALAARREVQQFSSPLAADIDEFQQQLATWSSVAEALEDQVRKWDRSLSQQKDAINPNSATSLKKTKAEFQKLAGEIMEILISRNDRDIDPERKDRILRKAVDRLAELSEIDFIDPREGERVTDGLHKSVATVPSTGRARKGTVASVKTRGLTQKATGKVIRHADVVEYK
jgi:hypothetical protein